MNRLEDNLEKLTNDAIDIAEQMLNSSDNDAFMDLLDEFNVRLAEPIAEELLSRCHSVVTEEIYKFVKEKNNKEGAVEKRCKVNPKCNPCVPGASCEW
jgi:phosphoribosylamine-glycine ligase